MLIRFDSEIINTRKANIIRFSGDNIQFSLDYNESSTFGIIDLNSANEITKKCMRHTGWDDYSIAHITYIATEKLFNQICKNIENKVRFYDATQDVEDFIESAEIEFEDSISIS